MRTLREKFIANYNNVGNNQFTQLKRCKTVALYARANLDGKIRGYEVFLVKIRRKGDKLPGGMVEKEDREVYPGASAFGKIASNPKKLDMAEQKYEEYLKLDPDSVFEDGNDSPDESNSHMADQSENAQNILPVTAPVRPKRTRNKVDFSNVVIPDGQFTIKELAVVNPTLTPPNLYVHVQKLIGDAKVSVVDKRKGEGRGKPSVVYSKTDKF